jgi:hypothetical protein
MTRDKTTTRPRCGWCGAEIKGKLRQAARFRGVWYCNSACWTVQGQRGRTRAKKKKQEAV